MAHGELEYRKQLDAVHSDNVALRDLAQDMRRLRLDNMWKDDVQKK